MIYAEVVRRAAEENIKKNLANPWVKDGRILTDAEAVEEYGLDAILQFAVTAVTAYNYNGNFGVNY